MTTPDLRTAARRLAHTVDHEMGPGDVAALRRLTPGDAGCPAFWRACATVLGPEGVLPDEDSLREWAEHRWAVVCQALATTQGLHGRVGLGRALTLADFSELRFTRLLRAEGAPLFDEVRTVAHFLASKAAVADPADFADLMLRSGSAAERVRRRLARDFYSLPTPS